MGHPEIFYSEVMNDDAAGTRSGVEFDKINTWYDDPTRPDDWDAGFVIIDPSAGKKTSDDVAIGVCLCAAGEPVLRELRTGRFNPAQQCDESIKLAAKYGLSAIVVEDVAYQATLLFWMEQRLKQLGIAGIKILPINPEREKKVSRIKDMLKQLTSKEGRVWVHKEVRSAVVHQVTYFDPMRPNQNKDDILDIMAYMYKVISKYRWDIQLALDMTLQAVESSFSDNLLTEF
jgi:tRNA uridine 5-carbamoylmethylation protein Kti12